MEHMAWKGRIKPGCKAEYQKRHAEIWPEMVKVLKDAGICNYSIFYCNDELFGYYECEKGVAYAEKVQAHLRVLRCKGVKLLLQGRIQREHAVRSVLAGVDHGFQLKHRQRVRHLRFPQTSQAPNPHHARCPAPASPS